MSGHTPGTWRTGRKVFRTVYADDKLIGMMDRAEDAALCAGAPELLEACEGMLAALDGTKGRRWEGEFADRCRAAIAKAKGE